MNFRQKIGRLFWLPIGLINSLLEAANEKARDIQNKRRFPHAIIDKGSSFTDNVTIGQNTHICNNCTINYSDIGAYSYVNYESLIQHVTIGNYCSISHNVKMGLGAHPLHLFSTSPIFYRRQNAIGVEVLEENIEFKENRPITIGSDVWIGTDAIIMDGVQIGNGAIIAAGAVVTKNVPAYAIIGGIPAKIIKYRFEEIVRKELEKSKWWLLEPKEVYKMKDCLDTILEGGEFKGNNT